MQEGGTDGGRRERWRGCGQVTDAWMDRDLAHRRGHAFFFFALVFRKKHHSFMCEVIHVANAY